MFYLVDGNVFYNLLSPYRGYLKGTVWRHFKNRYLTCEFHNSALEYSIISRYTNVVYYYYYFKT